MLTMHRHRSPATHPAPSATAGRAAATVSVSQGVSERVSGLTEELGPGIEVVVDEPSRGDVIVVGGVGPAGIAFLAARYPSAFLMAVVPRGTGDGGAYLDAGADAYLAGASLAEVAAHARALLRRSRARPAATATTAAPSA